MRIGLVDASGISGDGAIIILTFLPTSQGGTVTLAIENVEATDVDLKDLVVQASPGQFIRLGDLVTPPVLRFRK